MSAWWESLLTVVGGGVVGAIAGRLSKRGDARDKRAERVETHVEAAAVAHEAGQHAVRVAEVGMVPAMLRRIESLETSQRADEAECRKQLAEKDEQIDVLKRSQDMQSWLLGELTDGTPLRARWEALRKQLPDFPPVKRRDSPAGGMPAVHPSDPPASGSD